MIVKLVTILAKVSEGYKVTIHINGENIVAEWVGKKPKENREYDVELDIDDHFAWGDNIFLSTEKSSLISQDDNHINIVAKLNFNYDDNHASINVNGSIVLIELKGIHHDVFDEWVNLKCTKVKVYDTNL
ncbi:hypothetical protein [Clostridium sp. HMP27]|uniref:hypothetical protein n=1 Tax=Clostridium sp. HMP27 TaxID=1487921 RepID=UPI00052D6119|nr:hypothetical protein [Clostridium sp. HMP27]KGK81938.1 hypothetical protein DP68_17805 [Clostridium sp. HMP27]